MYMYVHILIYIKWMETTITQYRILVTLRALRKTLLGRAMYQV